MRFKISSWFYGINTSLTFILIQMRALEIKTARLYNNFRDRDFRIN